MAESVPSAWTTGHNPRGRSEDVDSLQGVESSTPTFGGLGFPPVVRTPLAKTKARPDPDSKCAYMTRSVEHRASSHRKGPPTAAGPDENGPGATPEPSHAKQGNALRAGVLGSTDGLVSNLSLVLGVAGSGAARAVIVIAGLAGLVADRARA
jgi:hypothetical protein